MKCKQCGKRVKRIVTAMDYEYMGKKYRVINIPVFYCAGCDELILHDAIEERIVKFIPRAENGIIDYMRFENTEL